MVVILMSKPLLKGMQIVDTSGVTESIVPLSIKLKTKSGRFKYWWVYSIAATVRIYTVVPPLNTKMDFVVAVVACPLKNV